MGNRVTNLILPERPLPGRTLTASALVVLAVLASLGGPRPAGAGTAAAPQIPGSPAAPTAAEITPICTTTTPASTLGPAPALPPHPVSTVAAPAGGVVGFAATSSGLYVDTGTDLVTYSLAGLPLRSFPLPTGFTGTAAAAPVVDPSGDVYLSSYYGKLVDKFSPAGALLWSVDPEGGNPTGLYSTGAGATFTVVVSIVQDATASLVLDQGTGAVAGSFPLVDDGFVTREAGGDLLYSADGYVETVSPTGTVLSRFGAAHTEGEDVHTGSGTQFYYPAQAVQGPDGTIYTADPLHTVEATSPDGFLESSTTLDGALDFGGWGLALVGGTLYFQSGPPFSTSGDSIASIPLATLEEYLAAVRVPSDSLGWGAGLGTSAVGNYFPSGTTPSVTATFDPWWAAAAPHLRLSYSVEDVASLDAGTVPTPSDVSLPVTAAGLADVPLTLPAADTVPGPYQVRATLLDTATDPPTTLGTTCLPFTVGAAGDGLDFAALPAGAGSGGPADPRGVAMDAQLGLSGLRSRSVLPWHALLPACVASAPTRAACGPGALRLDTLATDPYRAAYLADRDHVAYWIEASGGGPVPMALVDSGLWGPDVAAVVAHYASVPPGCGACAPVTGWEAWNEANNTGWDDGATYATEVLAPFDAAVKSVLPGEGSTVIGATTLGTAVGWWRQLVAAGGLAELDVAALHPYTGSDDAYEEDGIPTQVRQVRAVLGSTPLWFTEIGWWSDGDFDFLAQADDVSRALLWQKALGVPVENYFFDEGSFGNDGVSFSLVQSTSSVDYVKPAALSTMTTTGLLAGRPYASMPDTGIPHAYRADFGTAAGGTTDLAAVWTDGLPVTASVRATDPAGSPVPVTLTSEYGNRRSVVAAPGTDYRLPISGQVTFLTYPAGDTVTVGPTEAYGTDLASSAAGATAEASSGGAAAAIAGPAVGYGQGWTSGPGDTTPSITVTLASPATLDRVVVDTQSVGSTAPGLRRYTVSADEPGRGWVALATEQREFRYHEVQFAFGPVEVGALRVSVDEVDYGGYYGGGIPPWWSPTQPADAFLHSLEAYAGTGGPPVVDGSGLPVLPDR